MLLSAKELLKCILTDILQAHNKLKPASRTILHQEALECNSTEQSELLHCIFDQAEFESQDVFIFPETSR